MAESHTNNVAQKQPDTQNTHYMILVIYKNKNRKNSFLLVGVRESVGWLSLRGTVVTGKGQEGDSRHAVLFCFLIWTLVTQTYFTCENSSRYTLFTCALFYMYIVYQFFNYGNNT